MGQALTAQGGSINLQALTDVLAEAMDLPRLKQIIQFSTVPQPPNPEAQPGPGEESGVPNMPTTRNYVRRSVSSGGTPQARSGANQQAWLQSASQPQQGV
jgi:hypothetical protein